MELRISVEDVIQWTRELLPVEVERVGPGNSYEIRDTRRGDLVIAVVSEERIGVVLDGLVAKNVTDETVLYDTHDYEVLVDSTTPFTRGNITQFRHQRLVYENSQSGLVYAVDQPSDEYVLFLLYHAAIIGPLSTNDVFRGGSERLFVLLNRIDRKESGELPIDLFDLLRISLRRYFTLTLRSETDKTLPQFERLADAFFFQLAYNLGDALTPVRSLEGALRRSRIVRTRRARPQELEAPRRLYVEELVHHYLLAVGSESPALEFLSYYHIAEHFFEKAFNDELIENVRSVITHPGFSYRRRKDVEGLIKTVKSSFRNQGERITFSELQALRLTLARYAPDLDAITEEIGDYDESLIEYYRNQSVSFSGGDRVNLEDPDREKVFRDLAKRIYKTRNAIVHSKEGERGSYVPFKHDPELAREIPIMRFIAEHIIIGTSTFDLGSR